ncbi:hypothetical protein PSD2002_0132 [Escherichia phage PSD2002]|nr:hypothetical protein PSD2002_0132 [Escherichia phage PSD2002]
MNYQKIYDNLIRSRKASKPMGYTESHHIIPSCIGGPDTQENRVRLTPEEHFIAHKLLAKIYPNNYGLIKAVISMGMSSRTHKRQFSKSYGWERRQLAILQTGEGNPFYGKHHTEAHKEYMSNLFKGRPILWGDKISATKKANPYKYTQEQCQAISERNSGAGNGMYGKNHTPEASKKISDKAKERYKDPSKNPAAKKVTINGVEYGSMKQASEATGLSRHKIRNLMKQVDL